MSCITVYNKLQELAQFHSDSWADGAVITLGRHEMTSFPLLDIASLSNHHLSIRKLAGDFYIRDEQSSNGTTANGIPMTHALRMHAGVAYQAGPLAIYLENAPATQPNPEENANSVFPEPYGFALMPAAAPAPVEAAPEYPAYQAEPAANPVAEEPVFDLEQMAAMRQVQSAAPAVESYPAQPVYQAEPMPQPVVEPVVEEPVFDLAQMAAMKQAISAVPAAESYPAQPAYQAEPMPQPVAEPVVEEPVFDLEQMAAMKQAPTTAGLEPAPTAPPIPEPVPNCEVEPASPPDAAPAVQELPKIAKKRITYKGGIARPFLPIAGIPKTGIPQDFSLEITTPDTRPCIVEGEALRLLVRASEKCKIILICQEEDGTKTMLYPNKYQTSMDIPADTWVSIPEEGALDYELSIEGVGCIDTIQVIARKSTTGSIKRTPAPKKGQSKNEAQKPKKPAAKWAHALLELEVVSAEDS